MSTTSLISTISPISEHEERVESGVVRMLRTAPDDGCLTHLYEGYIPGIGGESFESTLKVYIWGNYKDSHEINFTYTLDEKGLYSIHLEKIVSELIERNKRCIAEKLPHIFPDLYGRSNPGGNKVRSAGETIVSISYKDSSSSDLIESDNEIYSHIKYRLEKRLSNAVLYPYEVDFLSRNRLHLTILLPTALI